MTFCDVFPLPNSNFRFLSCLVASGKNYESNIHSDSVWQYLFAIVTENGNELKKTLGLLFME